MILSEKKDIHNRKKSFERALAKLETDSNIIKRNKELILNFIRDCRLGKTLKKRQKKIIGEARCLKYITILKRISSCFDKPFDKVIQEDMERFIESLENDNLKNRNRLNTNNKSESNNKTNILSHSTKVDYKKTIKKFYKWLFGNNTHYPELVDWIDTYDIVKEIPAIKREEVERLVDASKVRDKTIIMTLFDSGARAEEFLNIKICDLTKSEDVYKVRIVHSKTRPRTIHLPIASKYIDFWLEQYDCSDEQSYLFPVSYQSLRMMLHRIGKSVLNKNVYPHLFRHSSATYYANLLNHQQLCYRYGWAMASDMPNRYLDREGIFEEDIPHVVKSNDISKLEKQNRKLAEEISLVKQTNADLNIMFNQLNEKYNRLFHGKGIMNLLLSLANKQDDVSSAIAKLSGQEFDISLNHE